jgi:Uma2 family endonuclease
MSTTTRRITYEDSLTMPENRLEEIVNGESRIMALPGVGHALLLNWLQLRLGDQLSRREYLVMHAGLGLGIQRRPYLTCRTPDLTVFSIPSLKQGFASKAANDPYVWVAPELLVECLSPSNRKGAFNELLANYASIGVPEAWILLPESKQLTCYLLQEGELRPAWQAEAGQVTPTRLPKVTVEVTDLWRAFDLKLF